MSYKKWCRDFVYTSHAVPEERGPIFQYAFEKALIKYPVGSSKDLVAYFHDGQTKNYGSPDDPKEHWHKLWQTVEAVRASNADIACGIQAALPHTVCVNAIQDQSPIHNIPDDLIKTKTTSDGTLFYIDDLMQTFEACFDAGTLPVENPEIHWARAAQKVDLKKYVAISALAR